MNYTEQVYLEFNMFPLFLWKYLNSAWYDDITNRSSQVMYKSRTRTWLSHDEYRYEVRGVGGKNEIFHWIKMNRYWRWWLAGLAFAAAFTMDYLDELESRLSSLCLTSETIKRNFSKFNTRGSWGTPKGGKFPFVKFQVFAVTNIKMAVFWHVPPRSHVLN